MSNILNLLSEETFIEKMDRLNDLLEYLVKVQGGVGIIPNYTWKEIQSIVRLGIAPKLFELGGQLSVNRNGEELVFDIVSFDTAVPADTSRSHSMTLMLHDLPWQFEFDTDRSSSSYYNLYKNSTIRQWLNSSESAGNWWSSIDGNTAPSYADIDGFMKGFDSDFLSVIGKTRIQTYNHFSSSTIEKFDDYFYLPSLTEMGFSTLSSASDYFKTEGKSFGYFTPDLRRKYNKEGSIIPYWTRTNYIYKGTYSTSVYIEYIDVNGDYSERNGSYNNSYGVCPVCNII